jgi:hypothetical protein
MGHYNEMEAGDIKSGHRMMSSNGQMREVERVVKFPSRIFDIEFLPHGRIKEAYNLAFVYPAVPGRGSCWKTVRGRA